MVTVIQSQENKSTPANPLKDQLSHIPQVTKLQREFEMRAAHTQVALLACRSSRASHNYNQVRPIISSANRKIQSPAVSSNQSSAPRPQVEG